MLSFIRSYNFWEFNVLYYYFFIIYISDFFYRFLGHLQEDPAREDRKLKYDSHDKEAGVIWYKRRFYFFKNIPITLS